MPMCLLLSSSNTKKIITASAMVAGGFYEYSKTVWCVWLPLCEVLNKTSHIFSNKRANISGRVNQNRRIKRLWDHLNHLQLLYIRVQQLKASFVHAQNIAAVWNYYHPWQFWSNSINFFSGGVKKTTWCVYPVIAINCKRYCIKSDIRVGLPKGRFMQRKPYRASFKCSRLAFRGSLQCALLKKRTVKECLWRNWLHRWCALF